MIKNIFWIYAHAYCQEDRMPYPPEHKQNIRGKILESARQHFNRKGFGAVTIEEIMAGAGLSHGGFYRYFGSKDELYAEAVRFFLRKETPEPWQCAQDVSSTKTRAVRMIDAYFSLDHFTDCERCCPLIGVTSDVARSGDTVKAAYREVVEMLVKIFEAEVADPTARERALAAVALCVGGMVLARGVDNLALADDLRDAAHKYALHVVGSDIEAHSP
jgi:TetR/AcrR family transcriptional regulator, transcriptional repressor for nem operon